MLISFKINRSVPALVASLALLAACQSTETKQETTAATAATEAPKADSAATPKYLSQPLISDIYTADPSAHVFEGKIYIYPSHDIEAGIPENDKGDHFAM